MRVIGVIAELNPPHTGHQYLFDSLKSMGYTHLVVVLSGCFVQRGEAAIFSKWDRAKWALEMGADLVVSMPTVHSVSCAERFAKAGVSILSNVGVDAIGFGSECGDVTKLREILELVDSDSVREKTTELLGLGHSLAVARAKAVELVCGRRDTKHILSPNNILAVEYLRAIDAINPSIQLVTIGRMGVGHDNMTMLGNFTSASMLRKLIFDNKYDNIQKFLPKSITNQLINSITNGSILDLNTIDTLILGKWRTLSTNDIALLPDVSEGLEFRLKNATAKATNTNELIEIAKTRRYTRARLKRILTAGLLGIYDSTQQKLPEYIHILGISQHGSSLLKNIKVPQNTSLSKLAGTSPYAHQLVNIESMSGDIYAMSMVCRRECGLDFTTPLAKVGDL